MNYDYDLNEIESTASFKSFHLQDYINILKRRMWIICISFFSIVGVVTLISLFTTPEYVATTQLIMEKATSPLDNTAETKDKDFYQTQYNLLRSRGLAYTVIKELKLWNEYGYKNVTESQLSIVADRYLANLHVTPVHGSSLVNISFSSPNKKIAALVANTHVETYIRSNNEVMKAGAERTLSWLDQKLNEQKSKLEESQRKVYEFQKKNDIVSFEGNKDMVSQKLLELNSTLTDIKSKHISRQSVYEQLQEFSGDQEKLFSLPEMANDPIIQNLRRQLVQFKTKRLEMSTSFGPKHPKMIELNSSIKQLNEELSSEVERLKSTIKAELDRIVAIEKSVEESLEKHKEQVMTVGEKNINTDFLSREVESNQRIYDILLKHAKDMSLSGVIGKSNISIVDRAEVPRRPVKPKILVNIMIAMFISVFIGVGLAFFIEYMDNTVKTPEEVQFNLKMPVLAMIPEEKAVKPWAPLSPLLPYKESQKSKMMVPAKSSPYNVSGRLFSILQTPSQGRYGQVIIFESAQMGEGKSTVLKNYGVALAQTGLRVVMVDCDFDNPSLHSLLRMDNAGGVSESVKRVFFQPLQKGTLKEFSVDDLFFMAMLKRVSGQLYISNSPYFSFHHLMKDLKSIDGWFSVSSDAQVMRFTFANGRLLQIDNQDSPQAIRLGKALLQGGFITKNQMVDAIKRHRRTGLPFAYILINSGYITREELIGPLKLQIEESLYKIFSWKEGTFNLEVDKAQAKESERVYFNEDFSDIINHLGEVSGSIFVQDKILSAVKTIKDPNLFLINSGNGSKKLSGPLNIAILTKFMQILKQHFDVILVDAPPLLDAAEFSSMASFSDGAVFVLKSGNLSLKKLQEAKSFLDDNKRKILGAVLNQVKDGKRGFSL